MVIKYNFFCAKIANSDEILAAKNIILTRFYPNCVI